MDEAITKTDNKEWHIKALRIGLVLLGIAFVGLFSAIVWPTRYRYTTLKWGENVIPIRVDRFSDRTWWLLQGGWTLQGTSTKAKPLPTTMGIGGRCHLDTTFDEISCDISNETEYIIKTVMVEVKNSDGQIGSGLNAKGEKLFASVPVSCRAGLKRECRSTYVRKDERQTTLLL